MTHNPPTLSPAEQERVEHVSNHGVVLAALREAARPLASHQLAEILVDTGLTRQQVSAAVGHLRNAGKIKRCWGTIPGPRHGPKQVPQYEVMPQEEGLAAALAARDTTATLDRDGPTQEAQYLAAIALATYQQEAQAQAEAEAQAEAQAAAEAEAAASAETAGAAETAADVAALGVEALLVATDLDAALVRELSAQAWPPTQPALPEVTPMPSPRTAHTPACHGSCQHGDPCVSHGAADDDDLPPAVRDALLDGLDLDAPEWVVLLRDWLGPLPIDMDLYRLTARFNLEPGYGYPPSDLKLASLDEGAGAFLEMNARDLRLSADELDALDRYGRAVIWMHKAIANNATRSYRPGRPEGLDAPNPRVAMDLEQAMAEATDLGAREG